MDLPRTHRHFWHRHAVRLRRTVNLAWFLECLTVPLVIWALVSVAVIWGGRSGVGGTVPEMGLWLIAFGWAVAFGIAAWRVRGKFEGTDAVLVRMEVAMGMCNALTAAQAGVSKWPEPVPQVIGGVRWQWVRVVFPWAVAVTMFVMACWLPVPDAAAARMPTPEIPQSWSRLEKQLAQLEQAKVVAEPYIEQTRKQLDDLKSQAPEQWFSHASLEAGDTLESNHQAETGRLTRAMEQAAASLEAMETGRGALDKATENQLAEAYGQAMREMNHGAMKPNSEWLEQLREVPAEQLSELDPEQLRDLRRKLEEHSKKLNEGKGDKEPGEGDEGGDNEGEPGENNDGEANGDQPGRGGVQRGPGHDPKVLGKAGETTETDKLSSLQARNLSHAAPGDLLELRNGKHDVDSAQVAPPNRGGDSAATGQGGERIWGEALDPDEQRTLKRFFE